MIDPPRWSADELQKAQQQAVETFRHERMEEPAEQYADGFDESRQVLQELLSRTQDLASFHSAEELLSVSRNLTAFRYLSGPPVSEDDLRTIVDAESLSPAFLRRHPQTVRDIVRVVTNCLDSRRFPWIAEGRQPNEAERHAAVLASACLMAYQKIQTFRRTRGKNLQEERVRQALVDVGFQEAPRRKIATLGKAPGAGEFCRESVAGTRKADFVVGLWDERKMMIECKVSNSEINSVKRLNNDAAAKAETWISDFGRNNVVPAAVLSGVFKLANLSEAQERGLTLFWGHDLSRLVQWIERTRES